MKANVGSTMIAAGAIAAITMLATPSRAQNQPVQITPMPTPMPYPTTPYRGGAAPVGADRTEFVTPNPVMLGAGGLAFLGAYIPGIVVAASSDHDGDNWLYVPVAGPWIDWATRGCGDEVQTSQCGVNGFDRAALIGSGVLQGLGVLAMIGSFTVPQKRLVTTTANVQFGPASFGSRGQGIMAYGNF